MRVDLPTELLTPAQVIAARLWFRIKSLDSIALDLGISVDDVLEIMDSAEYVTAVASMMLSTRAPEQLRRWIKSKPHSQMVSHLSKRMGLSEQIVDELIEKVLNKII